MKKNNLIIINGSLIEHYFTIIRNKNTSIKNFRFAFKQINNLIINEVSKDFELENIEIETPLEKTITKKIKNNIILIPILRSGLIMLNSFIEAIPFALVGHIGIFRNKKTFQSEKYYFKIPNHNENDEILLLDVMIATGNTIISSIKKIKTKTKAKITIVSINSCNEGINKIHKIFPNIKIFTIKIDKKLNNNKYIVPGLGDAGDRFFGTI